MIARAVQIAFGFGTTILLARGIGAEQVGQWGVVVSVTALSSQVILLGSSKTLLKAIPESLAAGSDDWKHTQAVALASALLVGGVLVSVAGLAASWGLFAGFVAIDGISTAAIGFLLLFNALRVLQMDILAAHRRIRQHNLVGVIAAIYVPVALAALILTGTPVPNPFWLLLAMEGSLAVGCTAVLLRHGIATLRPAWSLRHIVNHLGWSSRYSLSAMAGAAELAILPISANYLTPLEVGGLVIMLRISSLAGLVQVASNLAYGPRISSVWSSLGLDRAIADAQEQTRVRLIPVTLICFVVLGSSPWSLRVFGEQFSDGFGAIAILVAAHWIDSNFGPVGLFLDMTVGQNEMVVVAVATLVTGTSCALLLVPSLALEGAALAILSTVTVRNVLATVALRRATGSDLSLLSVWRLRFS